MKESSRAFIKEHAKLSDSDMDPGKTHHLKQQEGNQRLTDGRRQGGVDRHSLLIWTALVPGDVVRLQLKTRDFNGTVESKTRDGLIVWMRDNLNERRLFHFHDCQSLWLMKSSSTEPGKHELEEPRESWSEEQDAQPNDVATAVHIDMTHLAEQLERELEYRSGTTHTRRTIGKRLLESMLQSNEGGRMTFLVLKKAHRLVRENAQAEYSQLLGQMDELAAELRGSKHWLGARFAWGKTAAARNLLIKRSGGYSPPLALTNELRRLAEQ